VLFIQHLTKKSSWRNLCYIWLIKPQWNSFLSNFE